MDELDAGLIQLSRRGGGGAVAELRAFGQHALVVARAAAADCERCAAAGGARELQSRWRALLLGLPAAAAYAAVAQPRQRQRHLLHPAAAPTACLRPPRLLRAAAWLGSRAREGPPLA